MNVEPPASAFLIMLLLGTVIAGVSVGLLVRRELKAVQRDQEKRGVPSRPVPRWAIFILALIVVGAFLVRFECIELRGMSHTEVYVPNIRLPKDISEPPPRTDLATTIWWHFHDEPHPQGYYFLMYGWTKLFGTSLSALRLPSVLFGVGSVILLFFLVRRFTGDAFALLAAALLAFNGHQVYWSVHARMFTMICFIGLVSSLLLLKLLEEPFPRPILEVLYVFSCLLGMATHIFFWPFMAGQIVLATFKRRSIGGPAYRILGWQSLAVILGTPLWTHALYRARGQEYMGYPSFAFLREFFSFGFVCERDTFSLPQRVPPTLLFAFASLLALAGLIAAFWKSGPGEKEAHVSKPELSRHHLAFAAVGTAIFILGLAGAAYKRNIYLTATAVLPLLTLLIVPLLRRFERFIEAIARILYRWGLEGRPVYPLLVLTLVPFVLLFGISYKFPLLISRGFLLLVPYVLAWIVIGISVLVRGHVVWAILALLLAVMHVGSLQYYRAVPAVREYREIAAEMKKRFAEDDLIFARMRHWATTPTFYHLQGHFHRLVAQDYGEALKRSPRSRVWVLICGDTPLPNEAMESLAEYKLVEEVRTFRCQALLFTPPALGGDRVTSNPVPHLKR
jgi:hypothetical protein